VSLGVRGCPPFLLYSVLLLLRVRASVFLLVGATALLAGRIFCFVLTEFCALAGADIRALRSIVPAPSKLASWTLQSSLLTPFPNRPQQNSHAIKAKR
jgi:hypothetical protein